MYKVAQFSTIGLICKAKLGKIDEGCLKGTQNFQFEAQMLLASCYDFRKSEARPVKNRVT